MQDLSNVSHDLDVCIICDKPSCQRPLSVFMSNPSLPESINQEVSASVPALAAAGYYIIVYTTAWVS